MKTLLAIPIGIVGVYLLFMGLVPQEKPIAPPLRDTPAPFVLSDSTKDLCIPFDPYPETRICPDKKMYHIQAGGWAFMGDLSEPHKSLPPLHPIRERGKESHAYTEKQNPLLARFTTRIAGQVPILYCGVTGYGAADPYTGEMWINSTFCNPLEQLAQGVYKYPGRQGVGLLTLVHEALHLRGILNEARTECVALQNVDNVARWWHVPLWWQQVILPLAYEDSYRLQNEPGSPYGSPKCHEDGPWDQTPYDGRWP